MKEAMEKRILKNAFGKPIDVEDVHDIPRKLRPQKFWSLVSQNNRQKIEKTTMALWRNNLIRRYFFGRIRQGRAAYSPNYWCGVFPAPGYADELDRLPIATGLLGKKVEAERLLLIAGDLPCRPILRGHGAWDDVYYPRLEGDWVNYYYHPAYMQTGR